MGATTGEVRDPDQIRADIDRTRTDMGHTVDAIQEQLNPTRLKNQAKEAVRNATVGKVEQFADDAERTMKGVSSDMFDTIKGNPVPSALVAVGLGWLLMERRGSAKSHQFDRERFQDQGRYYGSTASPYSREYDPDFRMERGYRSESQSYGQGQSGQMHDRMSQTAGNIQGRFSEKASNVGDKMSETASNVGDKMSEAASNVGDMVSEAASNVQDTVSHAASNVQDTVSHAASQAREGASHFADQAQHRAERASTRFQEIMDENPLMIGAAAIALGALIGFSLPSTEKENRFMGETRENLMEKAQDMAEDTMQKVQHVAEHAGEAAKEAAKDEAQKQNLTTS